MFRKGFERDWLTRHTLLLPMVVLATTTFTSAAPANAGLTTDGATVFVSTVEQLYDAVNDGTNAGATVVLAPGVYVLSAKDEWGVSRPNGGRLELQTDMSLVGAEGDPANVTIDASLLPASSFSVGVTFGRTGPVRIGRGSNTIEWLTVSGNPAAAAGIATELTGTASTRIRVAHVISGGSSRGIDVRNAGATMIGRRIDAEIVDNEFFGPDQVLPGTMTEGIRLANFVGADNGVIVATLSGNRAHGFQLGCIVANNRSSHAAVYVRSSRDRFFANARGCLIAGGLNQSPTGAANSNSTVFEAFGSEFVGNRAQIAGIDPGGIRVAGGLSTTLTNATSDNTVSVLLSASPVFGNQVVDFEAFGAIQTALSGIAGTNNHVTIALAGVSTHIDVVAVDSAPLDQNGTTAGNTVTVVRIP
jgi:hypothetical protein